MEAPKKIVVGREDTGRRLDVLLARNASATSRARAQQAIRSGAVLVNGVAAKASLRLKEGDIVIAPEMMNAAPLRAIAEQIPLEIVYEDDDLAVVLKPAGMMVHAGAGATESARNRGTLVNALLHHFKTLSSAGGELRPGIIHRLDRMTSGLIIVAKNDAAHQALARQFAAREVKKTYLALVHGWPKKNLGSIDAAIRRDRLRRTRMTARSSALRPSTGRSALTHYHVRKQLQTSWGKFALLEVKIETGRTHQIRVHMASLGHAVVGDTLYGAPRELKNLESNNSRTAKRRSAERREARNEDALRLPRNFLHSAKIAFRHPRTGKTMTFEAPLPPDLSDFIEVLEEAPPEKVRTKSAKSR